MSLVTRLGQFEFRPPCDDLFAERDKRLQQLAQGHHFRTAVVERQGIHPETRLQLGIPVKLIQNHIGHGIALDLDDHPHAFPARLVADIRNAFDFFVPA